VPLLPGLVRRNWQLKLSAFAMAVLLWTVPTFEAQSRQVFDSVPVRVALNDPQWALRGNPIPSTVSVTVSGPARSLFSLAVDRPSIVIPIDSVLAADTFLVLRTSWVRLPDPGDVVVEEVVPNSINLQFEVIKDRPVAVGVHVTGQLREGLARTGPPEVTPSVIRAFGPESRVEDLDSVFLVPLDLGRVQGSEVFVLGIDTVAARGLTLSDLQASVRVPVDSMASRELTEVQVRLPILESDPQLEARPSSVSVVLFGAPDLLNAVDPASLRVTLGSGRAPSLSPGQEERVSLVVDGLPEFVEASTSPQSVVVRRPAGS